MKASTPLQAWRKAAGYTSAAGAVAAFAKRYKCKPGKDGCPTVATWRAMEQTNGSICSLGRLDQVARLLGIGCCLRLRTAWPENFIPNGEPLSLRERVSGRGHQAPPARSGSKQCGLRASARRPQTVKLPSSTMEKRRTGEYSASSLSRLSGRSRPVSILTRPENRVQEKQGAL
jgi:hypothetical protein